MFLEFKLKYYSDATVIIAPDKVISFEEQSDGSTVIRDITGNSHYIKESIDQVIRKVEIYGQSNSYTDFKRRS